jgi:hypothetical protein
VLCKYLELLCLHMYFILSLYIKNNTKDSFQDGQDFCRRLNIWKATSKLSLTLNLIRKTCTKIILIFNTSLPLMHLLSNDVLISIDPINSRWQLKSPSNIFIFDVRPTTGSFLSIVLKNNLILFLFRLRWTDDSIVSIHL